MKSHQLLRAAVTLVPAAIVATSLALKQSTAAYLWSLTGVHALFPRFADTRVITSGWDCARIGIDVLKANPCDGPWYRPMNYPRIWLLPGHWGASSNNAVEVAVIMEVAFLLSIFAVIGPISIRRAIYYALILISFPVMLLLERGNNDLLIFALLVAVAMAIAWRHGGGQNLAAALIVVATSLKLYPIAAVHAMSLRLGGQRHRLLVAFLLGFAAVYAYAIRQDLGLISSATPRPTFAGYGLVVPIQQALNDATQLSGAGSTPRFGLAEQVLVAIILCGAALAMARRLPRRTLDLSTWRQRFVGALFSLGASVYALTFVLGSNWDYRLSFLILTLPQLFAWTTSGSLVNEARAVLAVVLGGLWLAGATTYPLFQIGQLALYALFVYFVAVLLIITAQQTPFTLPLVRITKREPAKLSGYP